MRLAIWDADFIPFYVCHTKVGQEPKTIAECKELTDSLIRNINNAIGTDIFLGCLTVGKCFRYKINPEYKGNRKYDYDSDYLKKISAIKEYLITDYKCTYKIDEYEADDLVIKYSNLLKDEFDCVIVSPDKDILYTEGKHYNPKLNSWVITDKEKAEYYFWKSMMVGDVIDNIKGCKGIGVKTAEKVLNNVPVEGYRNVVLGNYCDIYGECEGIKEFYKNYMCLYMDPNITGIERPELLKIVNKETV